jgi:membrane protease YdiL (CAAX protease family)
LETSLSFEAAVYAAWTAGISGLWLFIYWRPGLWQSVRPTTLSQSRSEALLALGAMVLLLGISVTTDHVLYDWKRQLALRDCIYLGQLLIVYSPILLVMRWRKQGPATCFLRLEKFPCKVLLGVGLSMLAAFVFLAVRGEVGEFGPFLSTLAGARPVAMLQTFLEGFAIGFLLYRFAAWLGIRWAAVIVAVLFMAGHLPNYMAGTFHLSMGEALAMAIAHAGIGVLVLVSTWKSQDIIVISFLHWFINAASDFTTAAS